MTLTVVSMVAASRSARFVAWANAVVLAEASPDEAAMNIQASDPPHRVDGLPLGDDATLPVVLAWFAREQAWTYRLVLPVAGDPVGLPGPGPLTQAALIAGEAALVADPNGDSFGLVPQVSDQEVRWTAHVQPTGTATNQLPSLAEADRGLAEALRDATERLNKLDVARLPEEIADRLAALRDGRLDGDGLAPGYPARASALLVRARRLRVVASLAFTDDGATLTASEVAARHAALSDLERAARHAETAAYNAVFEERTARSG